MSTDMPGTDGQERFRSEISLADAALHLDIAESHVRQLALQGRLRHREAGGAMVLCTDDVRAHRASRGKSTPDSTGKL